MLKGYVQPSRLGKVLSTAALRLDGTGQRSLEGFLSALPERVRSEVKSCWRRDPTSTRCRKPEEQESPDQVRRDDAAQRLVLNRASDKLSQEIEKLQAKKSLIDAQSRQIQERACRETRLKEEARVRKLEEERREHERQEQLQRRKQEEERLKKKYQAEKARGPRIVAKCPDQRDLIENFDREVLQVALGNGGYIALWDRAWGQTWNNIPTSLENQLTGLGCHQAHPTLVALSPDSDIYFVQFSNGSRRWSAAAPDSFTEAVADYGRLSVVAFGERGSWFVQWPDGSWQHEGLPGSLCSILESNSHRPVAKLSISGAGFYLDEPAWFIRWRDNEHPTWKMRNAPSELSEKVRKVQEQWGQVRSVEFGDYGEWVLRWTPWA